jgi:hypothetical protein
MNDHLVFVVPSAAGGMLFAGLRQCPVDIWVKPTVHLHLKYANVIEVIAPFRATTEDKYAVQIPWGFVWKKHCTVTTS